ncbi:hypothetical protein B0H10DRAFT_2117992 [Mycena sp. CBHHK59/15]|nr:hypothetical protein B0H10DRAFT_2117992 [Mycena sp. CBHHK59/15]
MHLLCRSYSINNARNAYRHGFLRTKRTPSPGSSATPDSEGSEDEQLPASQPGSGDSLSLTRVRSCPPTKPSAEHRCAHTRRTSSKPADRNKDNVNQSADGERPQYTLRDIEARAQEAPIDDSAEPPADSEDIFFAGIAATRRRLEYRSGRRPTGFVRHRERGTLWDGRLGAPITSANCGMRARSGLSVFMLSLPPLASLSDGTSTSSSIEGFT